MAGAKELIQTFQTGISEIRRSKKSDEMYEELRQYLEEWNERPYTLEKAKEIGDGFMDFFSLLKAFNDDTEENELVLPLDVEL